MKKLFIAMVITITAAMSGGGLYAQSYADDIIAKFKTEKNLRSLIISQVGTGGLFQIPSPVVTLKKDWISDISSTPDYLKIKAGNEKREWEILIAHQAIGNVSIATRRNKKANELRSSVMIMINENFSTPAFGDYLIEEYNKGEADGFYNVVFPGPYFNVGTKHAKIKELRPYGDAFGIIAKNGWETYNSLGAVSVIVKTTNLKKNRSSIACLGQGSPYGKDLGPLIAEKCTSGEIDNIIFFGISVPPFAIDEYAAVQGLENNYIKFTTKDVEEGFEKFIQYQKFSRVKNVVRKGKNMLVFF